MTTKKPKTKIRDRGKDRRVLAVLMRITGHGLLWEADTLDGIILDGVDGPADTDVASRAVEGLAKVAVGLGNFVAYWKDQDARRASNARAAKSRPDAK